MNSDTNHSDEHDTSTAAKSSQLVPSVPAPNRLARRSFLRNLGIGAVLLAPGGALLGSASKALAGEENQLKNNRLIRGDVAILQLLAAAERHRAVPVEPLPAAHDRAERKRQQLHLPDGSGLAAQRPGAPHRLQHRAEDHRLRPLAVRI